MMLRRVVAAALGEVLLLGPQLVAAADPLRIQPSTSWLGIDGNWSTFQFLVGSPPQPVNLLPSTTLSEIWVVEDSGCSDNSVCHVARGGVYTWSASKSWTPLGAYQLGLSWFGIGGNGDYGLETIALTDTIGGVSTIAVDNALIAGINVTGFYQGLLGIGATSGNFSNKIANPYISQLASTYGQIPSHSYGFTAGAYYAGHGGVPASLTLGGYDAKRFNPSASINFNLDPAYRIPTVNLRGISVSTTSKQATLPSGWTSSSRSLANASGVADPVIVDSSTPFMWLPTAVCDEFATALNLTYNETLRTYLYPNTDAYHAFLNDSPFEFTFSLSSYDDTDPSKGVNGPGVVNITISARAFAQNLRYPFESAIEQNQYAVPYFPLRRSENASVVIGRVFLQEAYMVMEYDQGVFSINQALFPDDPNNDFTLVAIERNPQSPYPAYVETKSGLAPGVYAGIAVGVILAVTSLLLTWCCCRRRSKAARKKAIEDPEEEVKDFESITEAEEPQSPVKRIFSKIVRRKKSRKPTRLHEAAGNEKQPVEVGAEANNQRYEMPVPPEPVELDSTAHMDDDETELGTEGTEGLSAYEIARRKLDRQLMGPVPTYTPPAPGTFQGTDEKTEQDVSPVAHYRPPEDHSPVSPESGNNSNSLPNTLPSPLSPHGTGWPLRNIPSLSTVAPPMPSPPGTASDPSTTFSASSPRSLQPSSVSRSDSADSSPVASSPRSPVGTLPVASNVQRTPIDPSRVICLGPLPENVRLPPKPPAVPKIITPEGPSGSQSSTSEPGRKTGLSDTLGSNFTADEEHRIREEMTRRHDASSAGNSPRADPDSPVSSISGNSGHSNERIDPGAELIHVPQMADRRYSWEEGGDRIL